MQYNHLRFHKGFRVALGNARSQAAEMVSRPGMPKAALRTAIAAPINGCTSSRVTARARQDRGT